MSVEDKNSPSKQDGRGDRFLSFTLGKEEYAIPLLVVKQVIAIPDITSIPSTPPHYLGIINLRGQVISVIDFRAKLGIKADLGEENAIIICDLSPFCLGVLVDSINSVVAPKGDEISEKPPIQSNIGTDYITSVFRRGKQLVLLLDISKALDSEDLRSIETNSKMNAA